MSDNTEVNEFDGKPSAIIIPFRSRAKPEPVTPTLPEGNITNVRDEANERLVLALANLNAALANQKEVIATWRESLASLETATTGLGESARKLHDNLGVIAQKTAEIGETSRNTIEILDKSGY